MKDIKGQRSNLDQRKDSQLGRFLEFLKFKKSVNDLEEKATSNRSEEKIKWEDKVSQKKLEISEAKKAWETKRKKSLSQVTPIESEKISSEQ